MSSSVARHHSEWLSVIEANGPFLTLPVLKRALPQGLEPVDPNEVKELRRAHSEWEDDPDLHGLWIRWVLTELLGYDAESLKEGPAIPATLAHTVAEHNETLRPDLVVIDPISGKPRILLRTWPEDVDLGERLAGRRWSATPLDRMTDLLRATGVVLGVVTNGERWTLVHAPANGPSAYATWEASIWLEERPTLDAFATLLGIHRIFGVAESDTLEALLAESADAEHEVTDQLGKQVRQAVELLVDDFGHKDREHRGALLDGIEPRDIYQAAVTVMMRLVFLLSAEERGLFLLGDPLYDNTYAVSTLRGQLQEEADRFGEEPLERRSTAWSRLLATFRMVYGGVEHEDLRLPAYGGSLFDPDRFSFLEGRKADESWRAAVGRPLPVGDRTVLHILDALQVLRFRGRGGVTEARRLSFRALDVEQIGHVYEGLLDHEALRVTDPAIGFTGKHDAERALELVEEARAQRNKKDFIAWLSDETGATAKQIEKALDVILVNEDRARLLAACDNDEKLADRIAPYFGLLRTDLRGLPQVYIAGSVYVTKTLERRASGTYYTPRSLAVEMVEHALEPLVYNPGPAEGAERDAWKLKSPTEILELNVCDMAMGSGAFLVAACRYLADRLTEAWNAIDAERFTPDGEAVGEGSDQMVVPHDTEDRLILAKRLVADQCLYGVDRNPMAVEMGKLSVWLITLAKDRPFSFVDHALKCGDSLLGVTDLAQIEHLHIDPMRGRELHTTLDMNWTVWQHIVKEAVERRREIEGFTVVTIRDAEQKKRILAEADTALDSLRISADVVIGAAIASGTEGADPLDARLRNAAYDVARALDPDASAAERAVRLENLRNDAAYALNEGRPARQPDRETFHWPVEFPEVVFDRGGFDLVVGNPPFQGAKKISKAIGADYRGALVQTVARGRKGNADLAAYFVLRGAQLVHAGGVVALLATNTIGQGQTREVCLDYLLGAGTKLFRANKSRPWPGDATVEIAQLWLVAGSWEGSYSLGGVEVTGITSSLDAQSSALGSPEQLHANKSLCFIGQKIRGTGFILTPEEAADLISKDSRNRDVLFPYVTGRDLNEVPDLSAPRWVINFFDWSLERAAEYPECLSILRDRVKPYRESLPAAQSKLRKLWWQFEHKAEGFERASGDLSRVIGMAEVSNTLTPLLLTKGTVYSQKVVLFAYSDEGHLGILTSSVHKVWVIRYTGTLRRDVSYTPTDCFETFPQPKLTEEVGRIAKRLDEHRRSMMLGRREGLTKIYNRIHDRANDDADVVNLRRLHVELDHAVADAYSWSDLRLDHEFYDTLQGVRYTLGPIVRVEVLDLLLELNHERYEAEVKAGLHDKKSGRSKRASRMAMSIGQQTLGRDT